LDSLQLLQFLPSQLLPFLPLRMHFNAFVAGAMAFGLAAAAPAELNQRDGASPTFKATSVCASSPASSSSSAAYTKPIRSVRNIQVGVRPYYLVQNMTDSPLKRKLESCYEDTLHTTDFSISHRGAALQFPEHTVEGRAAAVRQGAGIIECDVSFTKDRQLVCRHSQCDLHTSTNILLIPELAAKCTQPFVPASGNKTATASCCTSDITLSEFKRLCGKQDGFNASATTPQYYQNGTPNWRTELYSTCGTVSSHKEFIQEINKFGLSFTPEAKLPVVKMPFQGNYTQEMYIQQLIDEYKEAGIHPSRVWLQSFVLSDILYWVKAEPEFAKQAVFLDERVETLDGYIAAVAGMQDLANKGVKIIAPAFPFLLQVNATTKQIVPSNYTIAAQKAGLKFITWSLERSGPLANVAKNKDYYYNTILDVIKTDGQMFEMLDVLAQKVKILGMFSDWPATVTYYANCMGLKGGFLDPDRN
jgi:glycerophosphoryl diester phosphodiesterase